MIIKEIIICLYKRTFHLKNIYIGIYYFIVYIKYTRHYIYIYIYGNKLIQNNKKLYKYFTSFYELDKLLTTLFLGQL